MSGPNDIPTERHDDKTEWTFGWQAPTPDTTGMHFPVRCAYCSGVYDVGAVEVTARYVDCSMWKSPCCNRVVDDRGDTGWKSTKDYYRIGW